MAAHFNVPQSPQRNVTSIEHFKGIDLYNAPGNVAEYRSPEAPNMVRDEVGKVRKRMGYERVLQATGRINGAYALAGKELLHHGTRLSVYNPATASYTTLYSAMANRRSKGIHFNGKLYILDGKTYLVYDGATIKPVADEATVPTVIISRDPSGGGVPYDPINLLGKKFTDQFLGTAGAASYLLTASGLDADPVTAEVMDANGGWVTRTEGTHFTVNRTTGAVTFGAAHIPGAPPIAGVDNVRITATKTRAGYADRINHCDVAIQYGVGGAPDRIFCAGNPDYPNVDYYSQQNDPTYFGDTWYTLIGQDDAAIMGYTVLNNQLATYRSDGQDGRNVVVRAGTLLNGQAAFPITNTLMGPGVVSKYSFANTEREPLFLTKFGVYAITAEELTGEKYSQQRGLYISSALASEPNLEEAFAFLWQDFYLLSINNKIYLLDLLQKEYSRDAPYSSYQYEAYLFPAINARVLWRMEDSLWFGEGGGASTAQHNVCAFFANPDAGASYTDKRLRSTGAGAQPIEAYWDTPELSGKLFYKNKTFRYLAIRLAPAAFTGVEIFAQVRGIWSKIFDSGARANYFTFDKIDFDKINFSSDRTPRTMGGKIKLKKVDKVRFRLYNNKPEEPFGIYSFALEHTEPGTNYKR